MAISMSFENLSHTVILTASVLFDLELTGQLMMEQCEAWIFSAKVEVLVDLQTSLFFLSELEHKATVSV